MDERDALQDVGRGIAQLHLRLGKLSESVERIGAAPNPTSGGGPRALEALLDLVDALDEALAAAQERRAAAPGGAPKPRLLARLFGAVPAAPADEDLWRGLALAAARAHEVLTAEGVAPIPTTGAFDPAVQRAVEREALPANGDDASAIRDADVVVRTHRRGWVLQRGGSRQVLRTALVTVRRA